MCYLPAEAFVRFSTSYNIYIRLLQILSRIDHPDHDVLYYHDLNRCTLRRALIHFKMTIQDQISCENTS